MDAMVLSGERLVLHRKEKLKLLAFLVSVLVLFSIPCAVLAADEPKILTDLFQTKAFSGGMDIVYKLDWVGWLMNWLISVFCFGGMCLVIVQRVITILYKSNTALWDNVHDLKSGSEKKFAGIPGMAKKVFNGEKGTGIDVILGFLMIFLPDIQALSDYREGSNEYNLDKDDSMGTYLLKVALPTVLTIFFCTIGFSGTLWKGFGSCVEAMTVVADRVVNINLAGYVERLCTNGEAYPFHFSEDQTRFGSFAQGIAKDIYTELLKKSDDLSTERKYDIGDAVEQWMLSHGFKSMEDFNSTYPSYAITMDKEAKGLSCRVVPTSSNQINATAIINVGELKTSKSITVFGSVGRYPYISLFVNKEVITDKATYLKNSDGSDGNSGTSRMSMVEAITKAYPNTKYDSVVDQIKQRISIGNKSCDEYDALCRKAGASSIQNWQEITGHSPDEGRSK